MQISILNTTHKILRGSSNVIRRP